MELKGKQTGLHKMILHYQVQNILQVCHNTTKLPHHSFHTAIICTPLTHGNILYATVITIPGILWHCMYQKHHITFTTFFSGRIIWGIQQVTSKNPEKMVLEKTLQGSKCNRLNVMNTSWLHEQRRTLDSKKISYILWNLKVHYHCTEQLFPILSQINPVYVLSL